MDDQVETTKIAIFRGKQIRKTIHKNEWWFVVEDVVSALADSKDPKQYINKMRKRDQQLAGGWVQFVHTLSIETPGGPEKELSQDKIISSSRKIESCSEAINRKLVPAKAGIENLWLSHSKYQKYPVILS